MGYVKKAYRKIFDEIDNRTELPKGWDKFVKEKAKTQNLIIKHGKNKCTCTYCNNTFLCKKKIGQEAKCPNCHGKYKIKRSNLRYHDFKDYLSILEYIDDTFIIRYFELKTIIDKNHKPHTSAVEFAREIVTDDYYRKIYINDRVAKCQCHIYIYHHDGWSIDVRNWRLYTRNYSLIDNAMVFPNNIKGILKNTEYKYSYIWELVKHVGYVHLPEIVKDTELFGRIEILTKMGLYNLALKAKEFYGENNFLQLFGVSKEFYPFMKKYNITNRQLEILRLLQEKDINKIRYLEKFCSYWDGTQNIEGVAKYVNLNKFIKYAKKHRGKIDISIYKDYLKFAFALGLDLKNNKYAFPNNLKKEHDKLEKQYEIHENELINKAIENRSKLLSINNYQDSKFIIFPAKNMEALQDESKQQKNCVRTYAEDYANGESDIYFMRKVDNPEKSLVTVEVEKNRVVQSRIKHNKKPNKIQIKFLNKWEKEVLGRVA